MDISFGREATVVECSKIHPSPANNRGNRAAEIDELADSIKAQGLLQLPIVRPHPIVLGDYEIVCGERRWAACKKISESMPVIIRELSDVEAHEITVSENIQRNQLTPLEESIGIQTLINDGLSIEQIADRFGKGVAWVARRAKLQNLSHEWLDAITIDIRQYGICRWPVAHLELIARFEHHIQRALLENFVSYGSSIDDGRINLDTPPSIAELKGFLEQYMLQLSSAQWCLDDSELIADAGPCSLCIKRSATQTNLFDQEENKGKIVDYCLDRECWKLKTAAFVKAKYDKVKKADPETLRINNEYSRDRYLFNEDDPIIDGALMNHQTIECKKSDSGARRALVVNGPDAGKSLWVKTVDDNRAIDKAGKGKSPAELKEQLDKKRRILSIEKVIAIIVAEIASPDILRHKTDESIIEIALAWGCTYYADAVTPEEDEKERWNDELYDTTGWKRHLNVCERKLGTSDLLVDLARCVLSTWKRHLVSEKVTGDTMFAEKACAWLGVDFKAIGKQARDEIKAPKSWGLDEEIAIAKKSASKRLVKRTAKRKGKKK